MSSVTRTYFMLTVGDMSRAVSFYKEVLGPVIRTESDTWSELKLGDATVALHASETPTPRRTGLGVEVLDLRQAYDAILRMGGNVLVGPIDDVPGQLSYEVADTEGNTFTIIGLVAPAGAADGRPETDPTA